MSRFLITITRKDGNLFIQSDKQLIGTMYDNNVQKLIFNRPVEYRNDDLVIFFKSKNYQDSFAFQPFNNGTANTFLISNTYTVQPTLEMQIAFQRNGVILETSNILAFHYRKSVEKCPCRIDAPLPKRVNTLEETSIVHQEYDTITSNLLSYNIDGELVDSVYIPVESGGGGSAELLPISFTSNEFQTVGNYKVLTIEYIRHQITSPTVVSVVRINNDNSTEPVICQPKVDVAGNVEIYSEIQFNGKVILG